MGMATKCPECSTSIDEDFGLVTCPNCGVSLFIDMNGEAKSSEYTSTHQILQGPFSKINDFPNNEDFNGLSDPVPPKPDDFVISRSAEEPNSKNENSICQENIESSDEMDPSLDEKGFSLPTEKELDEIDRTFTKIKSLKELENQERELQEQQSQDEVPQHESETEFIMEERPEFHQPEASAVRFEEDESFDSEMYEEEEEIGSDPSNFDDVADFGNSSASLAMDGLLRYDILISGIDSGDLKRDFYEVINDKRFLWDAEMLMSQIKQGKIKIKDVSAVKATVLISRLRHMSVRVKWEQYAINEL